ncbi:MAG: PilZ domain-containing protein [Candidatus Aadella gelida]|nr:PilZ domain-containing protein [Candidatus Aadella gelida]
MSEKRRFIRFDILLDAICRRKGSLKKLKVNNFCRDGVGVLSDEALDQGEDLELEMMIPGDNIPIIFEGQIAWVGGTLPGEADHQGGIKFKKIKSEDRGRILEYIYKKWITAKEK